MMIRIHNSQYCQFLQQADVLRRSGTLCDAVISVKSQTFRAHRLVLACASRTLAHQLLQGDTRKPLHCTLEIFSPHTFQQVLDFSYQQAVEVPVGDLQQLLRAARLLEMPPLEEQCQTMLEKLREPPRQEGETHENLVEKDAREVQSTEKENKAIRGSLNTEGVHNESSSPPQSETNRSLVMETPSPHEAVEESSSQSPTTSPLSLNAPPRDSVISGPAASLSSHSSPQPPGLRLHPADALRRTTQNYSDMMAAHSFHPSQQLMAYPFCLPSQRMYPLLALPTQLHSSVVGYSGILCPYTQHLLTGSPELRDALRKGLLGKRGSVNKVYSEDTSARGQRYPEEYQHTPSRLQGCLHCSRPLMNSSMLPGSESSYKKTNLNADKACATCRLRGRNYRVERSLRTCRHSYGGEKPYQCKRCPKRFSLKHQLDTHHRVHTGEKPFECRLCGQRSRDYSAMIKHLRTHSGATPYQCTVCLEFCSSLATMQKHLKSHPVADFPPDWSINSTYLYTSHI